MFDHSCTIGEECGGCCRSMVRLRSACCSVDVIGSSAALCVLAGRALELAMACRLLGRGRRLFGTSRRPLDIVWQDTWLCELYGGVGEVRNIANDRGTNGPIRPMVQSAQRERVVKSIIKG